MIAFPGLYLDMPCDMVIGTPGALLCLSIWSAGWEPEGSSSKPDGPIALMCASKKPLIASSPPLVFHTRQGLGG